MDTESSRPREQSRVPDGRGPHGCALPGRELVGLGPWAPPCVGYTRTTFPLRTRRTRGFPLLPSLCLQVANNHHNLF